MARAHPLAAPGTVAALSTEANRYRFHRRQIDLDLLVGSAVGEWPAAVRAVLQGNRNRLLDLILWRHLPTAEPTLPGTTSRRFGIGLGLISGEGSRLAAAPAQFSLQSSDLIPEGLVLLL
jgi:hypothetical protein